jgi:hypothetical protein
MGENMPKWEYATIPLIKAMRDMGYTEQKNVLDKYGDEGWELVSVIMVSIQNSNEIVAYFKREKYKKV